MFLIRYENEDQYSMNKIKDNFLQFLPEFKKAYWFECKTISTEDQVLIDESMGLIKITNKKTSRNDTYVIFRIVAWNEFAPNGEWLGNILERKDA